MSHDTHDILAIISKYSTDEVVDLLQKNNLSACCEAVVRRQVNGATLLHLTERDFIQWKLDLTKPLRWRLSQFVENLNLDPGQYFEEANRSFSPSSESDVHSDDSDALSDAWSTDWEGEEDPSGTLSEVHYEFEEMNIRTNSQIGSVSSTVNSRKGSPNLMNREEESECIYANGAEIERNTLPDYDSGEKFGDLRRKLAEELAHGQRQNRPTVPNQPPTRRPKPSLGPKPLISTRPTIIPSIQKGQTKSPNPKHNPAQIQRSHIELPKPPQFHPEVNISDEDEDPPSKGLNRTTNIPRPRRSSPIAPISNSDIAAYMEPTIPTKPGGLGMSQTWHPSSSQRNKNDIIDTRSLNRGRSAAVDTDLGRQLLGGLGSRLADEVADMIVRIKRGLLRCCHAPSAECPEPLEPPEPPERSRQPTGSATFPYVKRQPSTRPLPQTPSDRCTSYTDQPWFHNIGRDQAIALVKGATAKFSTTPPNGYFLVRPSHTHPNQPWTLVLWYQTKVYNIPVRQRPDSRFALGSVKHKEQSFATIEDLINFCKREGIPLTSASGEQVGFTRLTESPQRKND